MSQSSFATVNTKMPSNELSTAVPPTVELSTASTAEKSDSITIDSLNITTPSLVEQQSSQTKMPDNNKTLSLSDIISLTSTPNPSMLLGSSTTVSTHNGTQTMFTNSVEYTTTSTTPSTSVTTSVSTTYSTTSALPSLEGVDYRQSKTLLFT